MKQKLWLSIITCLAYCIDKELYKAIEYLKEQIRVLKELQEKDKRILLNDNQRIRLARKAKELTSKLLEETSLLFSPDTILGWYQNLSPKSTMEVHILIRKLADQILTYKQFDGHLNSNQRTLHGVLRKSVIV
jgi:hypothetical protein